jgi:hypothetical protein
MGLSLYRLIVATHYRLKLSIESRTIANITERQIRFASLGKCLATFHTVDSIETGPQIFHAENLCADTHLLEIRAVIVGFSYCYLIEFSGNRAVVRQFRSKGATPVVVDDTCPMFPSRVPSDSVNKVNTS